MRRRIIRILVPLTLVAAACGGGEATTEVESSQPAPAASSTTTTEEATTTTAAPATTSTSAVATTEDSHDEGASDADRVMEVIMDEFTFEPEVFEVVAGETVEFVITNVGAIEHEFRASNEHRIEEHMASGHGDHDEEGGHHDEDGDIWVVVAPGETAHLMMTFPEDTTLYSEIACLLPGHYEAGMKAPIMYQDS